ncbi:carboxylesterase family protein [Pseudonocardia ailaonensis]|uniref:Carboxylic ester hydrolase n=1 Tax=Pseudonocardia ailaonensis TaxID=367279 RepID=A0ABN2N319_9PSEU
MAEVPTVLTAAGRVAGLERDGVVRYLGVPYAAPPVRFAPPQPVEPWSGVRECTAPGPTAPQLPRAFGALDLTPLLGGYRPGDDYLTVDVWAPAERRGGPDLPVMVFVHGGAFMSGEPGAAAYDGTALARAGVVLVSVTYRLGVEGFLPLEGGASNTGLRDQLAALRWVQDNAAAFGGDPGNVTVFGESAGGMSIGSLLGSPLSAGLFRRAIVQSGGAEMERSLPVMQAFAGRVAAELGVPATADGFRSRSVADALEVQGRLLGPAAGDLREPDGVDPGFGLGVYCPVVGDDVLPGRPIENLSDVDVMLGWNSEEIRLYTVPTGAIDALTEEQAAAALGALHPRAAELLAAGTGSPGERYTEALTELVFAGPARRLAAALPGTTHVYEFGYRSSAFGGRLGACHGVELPFVFGTLERCSGPTALAGEDPPEALAREATAAWVAFARTGDPGWAPWTADDPVRRRFGSPSVDVR